MRPWLISLATLAAIAGEARAGDVWSEPYPGVRHLARTTTAPNQRIHALVVDLTAGTVTLRATRHEERGKTVSAWAAATDSVAAINGDFFNSDYSTLGVAMGAGARWAGSVDGTREGFLGLSGGGRAAISLPALVEEPADWMSEVVGGQPLLVDEGVIDPGVDCDRSFCLRNPRTAVGIDQEGETLYLVVVDGRSTSAVGMSLRETATLMQSLGAWRALNLDGGGSTAMWIEAEGGVQNRPSDGSERRVANHIGLRLVTSPPPPPPPPDAGVPPTSADAVPATPDGGGHHSEGDPDLIGGVGCAVVTTRRNDGLLWLCALSLLAVRRPRRLRSRHPGEDAPGARNPKDGRWQA